MGRPPLPIGTYGKIKIVPIGEKKFEARGGFRDHDGVTRRYKAVGPTKGAAKRTLEDRFRERALAGATVAATARFSTVIHAWLAEVDETEGLSPNTKRLYRLMATKHAEPALGNLFLREVTTPRINECIRAVRDTSGRGAAKTTKSVINSVLNLAVRNGAISANPAREAISLPAVRKSATRALTAGEVDQLCDRLRTDDTAVSWDLPDLVEWMLYTGCRIGEALALRHGENGNGEPLLDLEARTWEVNATVIRVKGEGLQIQPRTKTDAGWRALALPAGAVGMIERRASEARLRAPDGIVFGSPRAKALRDPSNTSADLRSVLARIDFGWVTSHTFRKTVATKLDQAGLSARDVADQLGHANPSLTQDVYMGRNVVNAAAAKLLDR